MATTFLNLQNDILRFISLSGNTDARTYVKRAINEIGRDIWWAHQWQERRVQTFVNTVAPYSTGTVTFTNGSQLVTGVGTAFTSAMEKRKIALSYDDPWYEIERVHDGTSLKLNRAYVEDTAATQAFVLYQDVLDLASMDVLLSNEVVCFSSGYDYPMDDLTAQGWNNLGAFPRSASRPACFRLSEDSGSTVRMQVWPVPDDAYAIYYTYLKPYTDMTADADECVIPEQRRDLITLGAAWKGYLYINNLAQAEAARKTFERKVDDAIRLERRLHPMNVTLRPIDQPQMRRGRSGRFYWQP